MKAKAVSRHTFGVSRLLADPVVVMGLTMSFELIDLEPQAPVRARSNEDQLGKRILLRTNIFEANPFRQ
jgi:hypothetical protein